MEEFWIYLRLGFDHITDPGGYDHILFVVALCAIYTLSEWRQVLILVTAFTVGHSITLALATLRIVTYRSDIIELLIPITILITAIANFFYKPALKKPRLAKSQPSRGGLRYVLAGVFGLVHGLGFSNYLRSLLGREASIWQPLLAFNLGLELGQLLIVALALTVSWLLVNRPGAARLLIPRRDWILILSGIVAGMAISLILAHPLVAGE